MKLPSSVPDRLTAPDRSQSKLHGVITAMVTPLSARGGVDAKGLANLVEGQVSAGVNGLFVLGSTGEGPQLTDRMYREVARRASDLNQGRIPLLGGASDNSVRRCLDRLGWLAASGVEYGVLTLPFYGWPHSETHSLAFFAEVARRSPLPIVAYNLPKNVGWRMPASLLEDLCSIPNLVAIKDTHADLEQMIAIAASPKRPAHVSYFPGNSFLAGRLLAHGADGVVSTPSNIFPKPFVDLIQCFKAGRTGLAARIDTEVIALTAPLIGYLSTGAASIKGLLESRGICRRFTVAPWPVATNAEITSMAGVMKEVEEAIERLSAVLTEPAEDAEPAVPLV